MDNENFKSEETDFGETSFGEPEKKVSQTEVTIDQKNEKEAQLEESEDLGLDLEVKGEKHILSYIIHIANII